MTKTTRTLTAEERDTALLALAAYGGNSERAARALKEQGISITGRTLRTWRQRTHSERYIELAQEHGREIENVAVVRMRETILHALSIQEQALEAAGAQLKAGEAKDPSAVARNAAVVAGINSQHNLTYTGRPSVITQHESAEDILNRMQRRHPGMFVVEGTAEEVVPREDQQRLTREHERVVRQIERGR